MREPRRLTVRAALAACVLFATPAASSAQSANSWSLSPPSAPPVTVTDIIGMTTLGSNRADNGSNDIALVSPDGLRIASVVKRANLARSTVDYSLLLFRRSAPGSKYTLDTIATFSSTSNRPAIHQLRWLIDNTTLAFLAERPNSLPQVYTLNTADRRLVQRTRAKTVIMAFDLGDRATTIVYAAREPLDTSRYAAMRKHGFVVSPTSSAPDIIAGQWTDNDTWAGRSNLPRSVHVVRGETDRIVPLPDSSAGFQGCLDIPTITLSPTADRALVNCTPAKPPAAWNNYRHADFQRPGGLSGGWIIADQLVVLDFDTRRWRLLSSGPVLIRDRSWMWSPDGRSVVVANARLPLDVADAAERERRATRKAVVDFDARTGAPTVIEWRDSLHASSWNAHDQTLELVVRPAANPTADNRVAHRKVGATWQPATLGAAKPRTAPDVLVEEALNAPAKLVAIEPGSRARQVLYDPNPGLLSKHRFGREELVHWRLKDGTEMTGGLYRPPNYVEGRRYPLLIQTHGFDSAAFRPSGYASSGYAAQPLANAGIMVLQFPNTRRIGTPSEGESFIEAIEAVINHLDGRGLIERSRVGLQGWSRTCYHTLYFLTHSSLPIAAANIVDGVDFSYLQYLTEMDENRASYSRESFGINEGMPFGTSLSTWLKRSPGFNLERVQTPLSLTAIRSGNHGILGEWEPFLGLSRLGKPVELYYFPDGSHELVKPWERLASQQGVVDWYRFWFLGEEDPDPSKAGQYARWRKLRGEMKNGASNETP